MILPLPLTLGQRVAAGLLVALIVFVAGAWAGGKLVGNHWKGKEADWIKQAQAAKEAARAEERRLQEVANDALRTQNTELAKTADSLRADLDRLRKRPARLDRVPEGAGLACPGATGAGLFAEDAIFLRREAARADELRAGLEACYRVLDALP